MNPLYASDASVEQFMRECGLELSKASDFKVEDQEFFEFSDHIINETVKTYRELKIGDLVATGTIILTRLAQELQKLDGEMPHNPKNAHNLLVIANYKLESNCYFSDIYKYKATRYINGFSARYAETSMIRLYGNIYNNLGNSDTHALSQLHLYYQLMHPYEKAPVKNFRQLSLIAAKTLLITAIMQDAVMYGMRHDIQDLIYQWNNDERISPNDQIKTIARYTRNNQQRDIDLFLWNLFGDQMIEWKTFPCKGCETCESTEMITLGQIIPRKLAWLPRWILNRLY
jgi:hypothetical protein